MLRGTVRCCVFLFVFCCATLSFTARLQAQESKLQFEKRTEKEITGFFSDSDSVSKVSFESGTESGNQITTKLEVNGLGFDAHADLPKRSRFLDGHKHKLSANEKNALIRFSHALESDFAKIKNLPPQEDFLLRIAWYLAEAPVGMSIQSQRGICPDPKSIEPLQITIPCNELQAECSAPAGDKNDDDGITLLAGECKYLPYEIWHDAGSKHGFCKSIQCLGSYSDSTTDCTGRCGPGCPTVMRIGVYSLDCAEHDVCCGLHGKCFAPIGVVCAYEFQDAFLDTVCLGNAIDCS
jgi:hypothetical protein